MPKKLELSWIASLRQWRKRRKVDGKTKTFYLGTGKGKTDLASYAIGVGIGMTAFQKVHEVQRKAYEALTPLFSFPRAR